ncbi:hypothetical protein ACSS6W_010828 [Trichoderma asperelloides]
MDLKLQAFFFVYTMRPQNGHPAAFATPCRPIRQRGLNTTQKGQRSRVSSLHGASHPGFRRG